MTQLLGRSVNVTFGIENNSGAADTSVSKEDLEDTIEDAVEEKLEKKFDEFKEKLYGRIWPTISPDERHLEKAYVQQWASEG